MADLDVEIDVPDDDDLDPPIRVLNGGWVPPWLKALAVLVVGGVAAITIAGFLLGRTRAAEEPAEPAEGPAASPTSQTAPIDSATASPNVESSLGAVEAWETFARTGDLADLAGRFDPAGPQYSLFAEQAQRGEVAELDFAARNLAESTGDSMVAVSMDLVISSSTGQAVYPYDLVYLNGDSRVWTVVDRREPGSVALPPSQATIDLAQQSWSRFTGALPSGDGAAASEVVSERSRQLAERVSGAVATGDQSNPEPLSDPELFSLLVERARAAGAQDAEDVLISLLDQDQREALTAGELALWTQIDPERVIASLQVGGEPLATVPFVASTGGWVFDLAGALETSQGESA